MSKNEYHHLNKLLYENKNSNHTHTFELPNSDKSNTILETKLQDDIFLMKNNIIINQDTKIQTNSDIGGLLLTFNFKSNHKYKSLITDYNIESKDNFTTIGLINREEGIEDFKKDSSIQSINIIVKKEFLKQNIPLNKTTEKIFKSLENKNCNLLLKNKKMNHKTAIIANDIFLSNFTGSLEKIFIHSKTLEILYTEFNDLFSNKFVQTNRKIKFDDYDINALYLAKDILLNNIQNPPSIIELSKMVKLNEFKLKIGFKKLFDTTPYKYLHEYRMQQAKHLLQIGDMNVTEVSNKIGYKYIHSFSKVFAQRFGILPKDLMKNRKYYYY
ncbi:AraC family transcriptional regulator [Sulfurimonas sp.]|uniref:helix-turn-helix domain-containing protein n=1 Tax=Sulfurimonas sp. TaxID=2022749 RepID=UPI002B462CC5|nr:AraC family transcriptional regulator [Sulfurimonas sp.]